MIRVCSETGPEGSLFPVDPEPAPGGPQRAAGPDPRQSPRLLPALGQDLGVPGAAEGQAGRRRPQARPGLPGRAGAAGLAGGAAGGLRRRRPGDAAPGGRQPAGQPGRARDQARPRRAAGHRVRRPAAPARARQGRRDAARSRHAARARRPGGRRVRGQAGRGEHGPRPTGSCGSSSTCSSCASCGGPIRCRPTRRCCASSAGRCARCAIAGPELAEAGRRAGGSGRPGGRADDPLAAARRGRQAAAREAVLPAAARRGRAAARRRDQADLAGRGRPARGARLRRPGRGAPPHRGADHGRIEEGSDPADAAARDARLVRRRAAARRRACWRSGRSARRSGRSPWYLRLLRDDTNVAWRMARLLASGRYATDLLLRAPEAVAMLGRRRPARARGRGRACGPRPTRRCAGTRSRPTGTGAAAPLLALRRRELFRTAAADLLGQLDCLQVGQALGTVTAVTVAARSSVAGDTVGRAVRRAAGQDLRGGDGPVRRARDGLRQRRRRPVRVRAGCPAPTRRGRDQGRARGGRGTAPPARPAGPRSVRCGSTRTCGPRAGRDRWCGRWARTAAYYGRWARPWEVQALLRAEPVAGDSALCGAFSRARRRGPLSRRGDRRRFR